MRIVIQCAGSKRGDAGSFLRGRKIIKFVARTNVKSLSEGYAYARPDDVSDDGNRSWRERLLDYNQNNGVENPYNLLPAYELYENSTYRELVDSFGADRIFILSAGWGLISAGFLTPVYDITFSSSGTPYSKRRKGDRYEDFNMLPDNGEDIFFLGGQSYQSLFCSMVKSYKGKKVIFYKSKRAPNAPGSFELKLYETPVRYWYYACAKHLIRQFAPDRNQS